MNHATFEELHDHVYGFRSSEHVAACAECGRRAGELQAERQALEECLAEEASDEEPPPVPAALLSRPPSPRRRVLSFQAGVAVGAAATALFAFLGWTFMMTGGDDAPTPRYRVSRATAERKYGSASAGGPDPMPRVKGPAPESRIDVPFFTSLVNTLTHHINMRGIAAETLRLKGQPAARQEVLKKMQEEEADVQSLLKKLADAGVAPDVPDRLQVDDRILALGDEPVADVPVAQGRAVLEKWLRSFRPPALVQKIHVARGGQRVTLYVGFPRETTELLKLARLPDMFRGGYPPAVNPGLSLPTPTSPTPPAGKLLEDIKRRFELLPKGYRLLLDAGDRTRLERLEKSGSVTPEDRPFLVNLQQKVLPNFEAEAEDIRSKVRNLQARVLSEVVAVDVVHFKSPPGRKVEGKIVNETDTHVEIKLRFGAVKYAKAEILRVEKGGGAGGEFQGRYEKAKGNLKALEALLDWCRDKKLRLEREYVGHQILILDPTHEPARQALRRPRPIH